MDYGRLFTTSDIATQLKRLNRDYEGRQVWSKLYNAVDLSADRSASLARQQYDESISKAYNSAYAQLGAINSSNIGSGFKEALSSDVENSLKQAYENYRNTYASSLSSIEQQKSSAIKTIDDELSLQSKNTKSYIDSLYDYLSDLHTRSEGTIDGKVTQDKYLHDLFTNDPLWKRWTTAVTDESGNEIGRALIDKNTLLNEFYDDERNLNDRGRAFYNQMVNSLGTSDGTNYSYGAYLSKNKPELLEWASSTNLQGVRNYDMVRDLLGVTDTFDQLTGLTMDDFLSGANLKSGGSKDTDAYKNTEEFLHDYGTFIDDAALEYYGSDSYYALDNMESIVGAIKRFGLKDKVASDLGMSVDDYLANVRKTSESNAESKAEDWVNTHIKNKYKPDADTSMSDVEGERRYLKDQYMKSMPLDLEYAQSQYDRLLSIVEKYLYSK